MYVSCVCILRNLPYILHDMTYFLYTWIFEYFYEF